MNMALSNRVRPRRRRTTAIAASVTGALLLGGVASATSATAADGDAVAPLAVDECTVNAVISEDITWSYSDQNLSDTIAQLQAAIQGFVGTPPTATLGVTSFGQIAPIPTAPTLTGVDVQSQAGADELSAHVGEWWFDGQTSSFTNWEAGLLNAKAAADAQGATTILFVTDGVPNSYIGPDGQPTDNGGAYDPVAVTEAKGVADQLRAEGYNLVPVFVATDRPALHGLNDPVSPTPAATVESAMQALQPGWTIGQAIEIDDLAAQLRDNALATCTPGIDLVKSHQAPVDVNGNGLTDAGDTVVFTFDVTNTGDLPLTDVTVTDPTLAGLGVSLVDDGYVGDLAVNGTAQVLSNPYTITLQDVINGSFVNVATVDGDSPVGPVDDEDDDNVPTGYVNGISIEKSHADTDVTDVNGNGLTDAGDTVVFTFAGANTGSTTLTDVVVTDEVLASFGVGLENDGLVGTLTAGQTYSIKSEPYTLLQSDVDAGQFVNVATVTGTPPVGEKPTDEDDDVVTPDVNPAIQLEKSHADADVVDVNKDGLTNAGDTVVFTLEVTNTGTVTLTDVVVVDETLANAGVDLEFDGQLGTLTPGEVRIIKSKAYTLTAEDVDRGYFLNVATATGTAPNGEKPTDEDDDKVTTQTAPAVGLAITGLDSAGTITVGVLAALLIVAGAALFIARRRRDAALSPVEVTEE